MQREHDERSKLIAEQALDRLGEVKRELEIPATDALRIDLWLKRRDLPERLPGYLLLLAMLFATDCIIEVFGSAVRLVRFWESVRKQYAWRKQLEKEAGKEAPAVEPPRMWVLSAGRPDALFERYDIRPKKRFPRGVYEIGQGWNIGLVVIGELPAGLDTLLLRLMGSKAVLKKAMKELHNLPEDDPETVELRRYVTCLRHTMSRAINISDEERQEILEMTAAWTEFERYEQELVQKGEKKGHQEAKAESIFLVLRARGIMLSEAGKARIRQCSDEHQLDQWLQSAARVDSEAAVFRDAAQG